MLELGTLFVTPWGRYFLVRIYSDGRVDLKAADRWGYLVNIDLCVHDWIAKYQPQPHWPIALWRFRACR